MKKRRPSTSKLVRALVAAGKVRDLRISKELKPEDRWECLDVAHQNEAAIAEGLKPTEAGEETGIVLINRALGEMRLFAPLNDSEDDARATQREAKQRAIVLQAVSKVIPDINSGKVATLQQFKGRLPEGAPLGTALALISQARRQPIEIETAKGSVVLNATDLKVKSLESDQVYSVSPVIWGLDDFSKPSGAISFEGKPEDFDEEVRELISDGGLTRAVLRTDSDERTLAVLHYARFAVLPVKLDIRIEYQFGVGKRLIVAALTNEAEIVASNPAALQIIQDRYMGHNVA